jgi:hypothetical protein
MEYALFGLVQGYCFYKGTVGAWMDDDKTKTREERRHDSDIAVR